MDWILASLLVGYQSKVPTCFLETNWIEDAVQGWRPDIRDRATPPRALWIGDPELVGTWVSSEGRTLAAITFVQKAKNQYLITFYNGTQSHCDKVEREGTIKDGWVTLNRPVIWGSCFNQIFALGDNESVKLVTPRHLDYYFDCKAKGNSERGKRFSFTKQTGSWQPPSPGIIEMSIAKKKT